MENRIKEIRKAKGMTQAELANAANISRSILCQLECGKRDVIKTSTMVNVARALGEPIDRIFVL